MKIIALDVFNVDKAMSTPATDTPSSIPFNRLETKEVDELAQYLKHADIELIQTSRSNSPSNLTMIPFEKMDLQIGNYGAASICNASTDKEKSGIIYKIGGNYHTKCNGYDVDRSFYIFHARKSDHITINKGPCRWAYLTFTTDYIEESLIEQNHIELDMRAGQATMLQCHKEQHLNSLYGLINDITEIVDSSPETLQDKNIIKGIESSLLDSQLVLLSNTLIPESRLTNNYKKPHDSIIRKSNDFFKENSYKPLHLVDLCSALNISLRTLYYAFQEFYGISPMRYLRLVRYSKARKDLLDSDPKKTSVSEIAAKWHFWQFGRFSVEYKSLYGESPSETLNDKY